MEQFRTGQCWAY